MEHETMPTPRAATSSEVTTKSVCAVVIAFFPDNTFQARLNNLLPQVEALVVVDNTPMGVCKHQLEGLVTKGGPIHIIENHANVGIAAALNQGIEYALQIGCKWVLTLDQDTQCYPDMVDTLLHVYKVCEPKPAVVGGNYFDSQLGRLAVRAAGGKEYLERKTVITSGSLIEASLARSIGGFREDYFIDQVDHEFCLRARSHGYQIVITHKPVMAHSVGNPGGVQVPFLGTLPNHPALRKYYIARNTAVTVAKYWYREPAWCLRRLVRLILGLFFMAILEKQNIAKVRAFMAGIMDGARQRMGPCQRHWLR